MVSKRALYPPEIDVLKLKLQAEQEQGQALREALGRAQETLKDKIALAALTGMLSHGTHHTPDKVMVMVYEFAEAGMVARGNNPERERCAGIVLDLVNTPATVIDPHPSAQCSARYASDALERIRSGK